MVDVMIRFFRNPSCARLMDFLWMALLRYIQWQWLKAAAIAAISATAVSTTATLKSNPKERFKAI